MTQNKRLSDQDAGEKGEYYPGSGPPVTFDKQHLTYIIPPGAKPVRNKRKI
jgi:hypothetical protein